MNTQAMKFNFNTVSKPAANDEKALAEWNAKIDELKKRGLKFSMVHKTDDEGKEILGEDNEPIVIGFKREPSELEVAVPSLDELADSPKGVKALEALVYKSAKALLKKPVEAGDKIPEITVESLAEFIIATRKSAVTVSKETLLAAIDYMKQYLAAMEKPEQVIAAICSGLGDNPKNTVLPKTQVLKVWGLDGSTTVQGYVQDCFKQLNEADEEQAAIVAPAFESWDEKLDEHVKELKESANLVSMF